MDVERTIEFILQHQAQFAAEMDQLKDQLKERHKEFSAEMEQLKERHVELNNSVEALTVVARNQQEQITQVLSFTEFLAPQPGSLG